MPQQAPLDPLPADTSERVIPYGLASRMYAAESMWLMDRLALSRAEEAKRHQPTEFTWSIVWKWPALPDTLGQTEREAVLRAQAQVFLLARGFKWRAWRQITSRVFPDFLETQIKIQAEHVPLAPVTAPTVGATAASLMVVDDAVAAWARSNRVDVDLACRLVSTVLRELQKT